MMLPALVLFSTACEDEELEGGADVGIVDAGGSDVGVSDAGDLGGASSCEVAAAAYAALCTSDGNRTCHVAAYASYCATATEPAAMAAALDCLRVNSDSGSCRTFSDPSGASGCVAAALQPVEQASWQGIIDDYRAICGGPFTAPHDFEPPLAMLSATQIGEVRACLSTSPTCTALEACLASGVQAPISACY